METLQSEPVRFQEWWMGSNPRIHVIASAIVPLLFALCSPKMFLPRRKSHLWFTPVAFPFYRGLAVPGKSSAASKVL